MNVKARMGIIKEQDDCPHCTKLGVSLLSEQSAAVHGRQTLTQIEGKDLLLVDVCGRPKDSAGRRRGLIAASAALFVVPLTIQWLGSAYPGGWCSQLGASELAGWTYWAAVMGMEVGWVKRMMKDSEQMMRDMWLTRSAGRIDEVCGRLQAWSACMECALMWPHGETLKSRECSAGSLRALADGGATQARWEADLIGASAASQSEAKSSASMRL